MIIKGTSFQYQPQPSGYIFRLLAAVCVTIGLIVLTDRCLYLLDQRKNFASSVNPQLMTIPQASLKPEINLDSKENLEPYLDQKPEERFSAAQQALGNNLNLYDLANLQAFFGTQSSNVEGENVYRVMAVYKGKNEETVSLDIGEKILKVPVENIIHAWGSTGKKEKCAGDQTGEEECVNFQELNLSDIADGDLISLEIKVD